MCASWKLPSLQFVAFIPRILAESKTSERVLFLSSKKAVFPLGNWQPSQIWDLNYDNQLFAHTLCDDVDATAGCDLWQYYLVV